MRRRKFTIPSLAAAGLVPLSGKAALPATDHYADNPPSGVVESLRLEHIYNLAAHSSHRSHSSHGSHRSSSGGSGYSAPSTPKYKAPSQPTPPPSNATPPSSILPSSPATAPTKTLPGNSITFKQIAMRVQAALFARGLYHGSIDGIIGPETRAAIASFQQAHGFTVNGAITQELLDALQIPAN